LEEWRKEPGIEESKNKKDAGGSLPTVCTVDSSRRVLYLLNKHVHQGESVVTNIQIAVLRA